MFSKDTASGTRSQFYTVFGQYMSPVPSASGEKINWINYRTGVKNIQFRIHTPGSGACIALEIITPDENQRAKLFQTLRLCNHLLPDITGRKWHWNEVALQENGAIISSISNCLPDVSILNKESWPQIIAFLKAGLISLDTFWYEIKDDVDTQI